MVSLLYYLGIIVFTVPYFIIFVIVFALTAPFDRERVVIHYASWIWAVGIFRICPFWRIKITGKEKIIGSQPWVVVTNHQSMLDIPLMYVLPLCFKWVSKSEVKKWPIFGQVLYLHGDILIERGSGASARGMIKKCMARLSRGTSVIIFPEGTRSKNGTIGRFKEGAFLTAQTAGVGIQPVVIEGTGSANNRWKIKTPHTFNVHILDPIPASEVAATKPAEMMQRVRELMVEEHDKMIKN